MSDTKVITLEQLNKIIHNEENPIKKRALLVVKGGLRSVCEDMDHIEPKHVHTVSKIRIKAEEIAAEEALSRDLEGYLDETLKLKDALGDVITLVFE